MTSSKQLGDGVFKSRSEAIQTGTGKAPGGCSLGTGFHFLSKSKTVFHGKYSCCL